MHTHKEAVGEVGNTWTARVVDQSGAALLAERRIGGDRGRRWREVARALRGMQAFRLRVGVWCPCADAPPPGVGVVQRGKGRHIGGNRCRPDGEGRLPNRRLQMGKRLGPVEVERDAAAEDCALAAAVATNGEVAVLWPEQEGALGL